jgi:hypothetical protein
MSAHHSTSSDYAEAPPGWYADPGNPDGRRYWDGSAWTQQTSSSIHPTRPAVSTGLVVAGYGFAVLAPLVGFILGLVAVKKHDGKGTNHGIWIIVTAVTVFVLYLLVLAGGSSA